MKQFFFVNKIIVVKALMLVCICVMIIHFFRNEGQKKQMPLITRLKFKIDHKIQPTTGFVVSHCK
jgi:hypothetical protein